MEDFLTNKNGRFFDQQKWKILSPKKMEDCLPTKMDDFLTNKKWKIFYQLKWMIFYQLKWMIFYQLKWMIFVLFLFPKKVSFFLNIYFQKIPGQHKEKFSGYQESGFKKMLLFFF